MEHFELNCDCTNLPKLPCNMVLAMAFVPFQTELITYKSNNALCNGTLFPELDKKFYGGKCCG